MPDDDNESNVWKALAAISPLAEKDDVPTGLLAGETDIKRALQRARIELPSNNLSSRDRIATLLHLRSRQSPSIETFIDWLDQTGEFSKLELDRIRGLKIIYENGTGNILLRDQRLTAQQATSLLALLAFAGGIWVCWIYCTSNPGVLLINDSFLVGSVLGFLGRLVLNQSFRFARAKQKVLRVAPWLYRSGFPNQMSA